VSIRINSKQMRMIDALAQDAKWLATELSHEGLDDTRLRKVRRVRQRAYRIEQMMEGYGKRH